MTKRNIKANAESDRMLPLISDDPIQLPSHDKLNRFKFAENIAQQVSNLNGHDPVVLAINAPWGTGKTSILKMLKFHLIENNPNEDYGPIVIDFNPWLYKSTEQLLRMFFLEIGQSLKSQNSLNANLSKLFMYLSEYVLALSPLLDSTIPIFSSIATKTLKSLMKSKLESQRSIHAVKADIENIFEGIGRRIVILIDDVDRLEPELCQILFQIVRLNADLSNMVLILAFDKTVVRKQLEDRYDSKFVDEYLDKIIQISYDIPPADNSLLRQLFADHFDEVISKYSKDKFDSHRFGNLFYSGFIDHLDSPRAIKRYINSLRFRLPLVHDEIDIIDFLAIELIRVFHPAVFDEIYLNPELFAPQGNPKWQDDESRKAIDEIIRLSRPGRQDAVRSLLCEIFPPVSSHYRNITFGDVSQGKWNRDRRISSSKHFPKYFLLAIPTNEPTQKDVDIFIGVSEDYQRAVEFLLKIEESGKTREFWEKLQPQFSKLSEQSAKTLVRILCEMGSRFRFIQRGMFDIPASWHLSFIVESLLELIPDQNTRKQTFIGAVSGSDDIETCVMLTSLSQPKEDSNRSVFENDTEWNDLCQAILTKIRREAESGALLSLPQLRIVLINWKKWSGNEEQLQKTIENWVSDDNKFVILAQACTDESWSVSAADKIQKKSSMLYRDAVADFIGPLEEVLGRLKSLQELSPDKEQVNHLVKLFEYYTSGEGQHLPG